MNKNLNKIFSAATILALLLMALPVQSAQAATTIAQWTFESPNTPTAATATTYPNPIDPATGAGNAGGVHVSASTAWSTPAGNGSSFSFSSNNWAIGDYYQFATNTLNFTAIQVSWDQTRSSTGPSEFKLAYSTDGTTFTDFGSPYTILANTWSSGSPSLTSSFTRDLSAVTAIDNQATVYFRLINNIAPGGTGGTNRVDNFTVSGTAAGGSTNPSGVGSANPATVAPGDPTLLTVTVTPGTNPTSTGLEVSCDLTSIGGSATQAFLDDGTNGDVTGGDNVFSYAATVDGGTSEGAKNLPCTISDDELRTGNASIALTVQEPVAIVINEILADPHATLGDANGDGVVETTNDEFVEIVNNEPSSLDISGWTLSDFVGVKHTFPANTIIPASCSIIVFAAGTPTGTFGHSLVQVASTGSLGLNNTGDSVTLNNGAVNVASYTFAAEGGDNQSLTRDPDVTGADPLVKHSTATGSGGALFSPGTMIDGSQFSGCPAEKKIHEVQGNGAASPLAGQTVIIEGIVVGDFQDGLNGTNGDFNGFHVQEEDADADADALTSEGIFVFDGSSPAVNVAIGDLVMVQGVVSEFNTLTEITSFTGVTVLSSGNALPTATALSLPVTAVTDFESYEGMLVTFPQALVISEYFNFDRFGEIVLTSERRLTPTAEFEPGSPQQQQAVQDFLLDKITLDDGRSVQNPDPAIHPNGNEFDLSNLFRGGDTVTGVTGIMDFAFGLYRIQPTQGAAHVDANPRPTEPEDVGGNVKVASFNVLNYFSTLDDSGPICGPLANQACRGADTALEFTRQRDKIIAALTAIDADVVGLIEIENHATDAALQDLVNGLNAAYGSNTYAYISTGPIGSDAIKVAMIYKPGTVTPIGTTAVLDSVAFVNGGDASPRNRPSLAQAFQMNLNGRVFIVDVNHFKSKGSECDGENPLNPPATGEGLCDQVRVNAATELLAWLAANPTGTGDPDVLIIGDLNSYDKEAPIDVLLAGGFTDLIYQYHGEAAYTYVFDGQTGYLDYALANATLVDQVTGVTEWHINADEPDLIDYDMTFKQDPQDAIYDDDPYRSSDHDPVVVGLDLLPQCNGKNATVYVDENGVIVGGQLNGQAYTGALIGTPGADVIVGTDDPDKILAMSGNDVVCALGANDVILGSTGNDTVFGGSGNDTVFGDSGSDTLFGEDGKDNLFGGDGADTLDGGLDKDVVDGGTGVDSVAGGDADDVVRGGSGNDALDGGAGNDVCNGGPGTDTDTACETRILLP